MAIVALTFEDDLWEKVMAYAGECSWRAGQFLAKEMQKLSFRDWERVIVAVEGETILGYCTVAKKDSIPDVAYTPYIGYMFVGESYRGRRLSERMIEFACAYLAELGFHQVYIVSGEVGLYEKYGFSKIDERKTWYGHLEQIFVKQLGTQPPQGVVMRDEKTMYDLILDTARADDRVRAVYMNGSRTNPNAPKDVFQDYDVVYVVTETASFLQDKGWITRFGDIAIVQEPDSNDFGWGISHDFSRSYAWLILFRDGNRLDLGIETKEKMLEGYTTDSLTIPLLDKDNCLPPIPPATDRDYWVKKPTEAQYKGCCNEFWWCLNNVAKGIARDELPYAMWMYNVVVRDMLVKMLEWYIGICTDFAVSAGKLGKYFKRYLPQEIYARYAQTYSDSDYNHLWSAIFTACELFRTVASRVAEHLAFVYNTEDANMMVYLNAVKDKASSRA